ncbi:MAG: hypothetical protein DMG97_41165 [Acidobacteria bacterium]|nr:MAG: hypothetical protein DMG97_41165 [Acidobacteriota bacterium]
MYNHPDEHHLERERIFRGSREWHDDPIHEKIDGHTIEKTRNDSVLYEKGQPAAHRKVDSSGRKRD